jgi:hypothetical protein
MVERKIFCRSQKPNPDHPARGLVAILTELPRLKLLEIYLVYLNATLFIRQ